MEKIAIIRLRGPIGLNKDIADTLKMLNLNAKNNCIILEETKIIKGMLKKIAPWITWGRINDETLKMLQEKRKALKKEKLLFALNSPKKGFGRKGIKMPFKLKGAYGNREEKINDLIQRML